MTQEIPIRTELLHAFVDGQLEPAQVHEVLDWLRAHPQDAVIVAEWQAQRLALRRLGRAIDVGETPDALVRVLDSGTTRHDPSTSSRAWRHALAAALLIGVGLLAGRLWPVAQGPQVAAADPRFVQDAVVAHVVYTPEVRHPVEVGAQDEAHLVQWLSRRLGATLKAPTLQGRGFKLLGGRLLPGEAQPRAQFMYEDAQGRRITLYVTVFGEQAAPEETAFRSLREGKVESFYWVEGRFGYALSAELPGAEVMALARDVYDQLSVVR